ncbi:MAG TPA: hypothetical protein VII38_08275, partial [Polyangia bacterium]
MASPAQPPKTPEAPREAPHFEISVEDGRGQLLLRPRRFFGWLEVERLELAIPHVTFPLDITGGMAQFQRQRCPVQAATFAVGAAGLFELVGRRAAALQAAGFEEVRLAPLGGAIELTAQARVRERSVELIARLRLEGGARDLRVRLDEALTLGWVRRPSMLLAHDLLCILFSAIDSGAGGAVEGDGDGPTVRGLGEIALRPLELFAAAVLSPAGWRLPEVSEVRLGEIAIGAGGVRLSFTSEPGQAAASPARAIGLARVEELLLHSDLAGAIAACREAILAEPDFAQPLTKHLLDLLCSRDSSLREAELIARDALRRWPDFLHARLSLAAAAVARDRNGEAAEQLAEAARLAEAHPGALAVRATLAAARAAVDEAPAQAIALFEQAAERCPGDERVVAALGVEYAKAGRWPELARLYQAQLAIEAPPLSRAATLLKMGELLALRLHDPDGARRHLEEATRLDPRSRRAFELYADLSAQLGDRGAAILALTRSAALLEEADDALAESRTRARIGLLCEAEGDLTQAREQYRRALARTPDDPGVLQAFAALAEAQHDTADALDAYQRLAHSPSAARESRRTAQEKLLGLYIEVEDLASARRALAERSGEPDGETLARLARLEESMGEMVPAAELLARAAAQSSGPRRAELELDRARLYRLAGDREDERAALERAHALSREGGIGEGAARGLSLLAREGREAEAEAKWLDDLIARAPADRDELSLRRAELHQLAGDAQSAKRLLDAIGEPARSRSEHARLYADVLGALGDPLGRATLLESLAAAGAGESAEERAALWAHAAESRLAAGDVAAAHRAALAAERLAATSSRVRAVVAEVAWRRRAWEEVVTLYDELFGDSRGAERVENGRRLGVALERLGQPKEALAIFERALGAEDAAGAAVELVWRACAEAHERAGDYPRTAETLKKAASDPRTGAPPAARAELLRRAAELLHRRAGASAEAAALYEEALALGVEERITLDALEALH